MITKGFYFIYKLIFYFFLPKPKLNSPTEEETKLIEELKSDCRKLKNNESHSIWIEYQKDLYDCIQKTDPRGFTTWLPIVKSMFYRANFLEYLFLKKLPQWNAIKTALPEDKLGNPEKYYLMPSSSGNLVHHAYSFAQILNSFTQFDLSKCNSIFEFGGGYGSLSRFLVRLGFSGIYYIYDLPLVSTLQKYFLKGIGINASVFWNEKSINDNPPYLHLINDWDNITPPCDLFIALWSISEVPIETRNTVLSKMGNSTYFLIAYKEQFYEIDNHYYFSEFTKNKPDYRWIDYSIPHLKGHRYLLGEKIK